MAGDRSRRQATEEVIASEVDIDLWCGMRT